MKYIKIDTANCTELDMTITCSHCEQRPLGGYENYCPVCGHKLNHIEKKITGTRLAEILNEHHQVTNFSTPTSTGTKEGEDNERV